MINTDIFYVEALIKIESPAPEFVTRYEWLILQVDNDDEEMAMQKANDYLQVNYNRSYQGDVPIQLTVVKIIAINPSIESKQAEVMEVYSLPFKDLDAFEKWRNSY